MARRKRIKNYWELAEIMAQNGQLLQGHGLNQGPSDVDEQHQDDFIRAIPFNLGQRMGRMPGRALGEIEENMLEEIKDAFDAGILNSLSERQRACFTDVVISGDTHAEVAKKYHISRAAVQGYIKRAAIHVREFIRERHGF